MNNKINFIIPLKDKPKENNKIIFYNTIKRKTKENNIYFLIKLPQSKTSVLEDDLEEEDEVSKKILEDNLKRIKSFSKFKSNIIINLNKHLILFQQL